MPLDSELSLQQLSLIHSEALFSLTDRHRDYLRRWLPWVDSVTSVADTEAFIGRIVAQDRKSGLPHCGVFHGDRLCGVAGFHQIDRLHASGTLGYWLAPNHTGRGIMTWAVGRLVARGFEEEGLHKIEIRCASDNHKSRAIPERLGFLYEGTLRDCEWLYDHYVDHAVYSLLVEEYQSRGL